MVLLHELGPHVLLLPQVLPKQEAGGAGAGEPGNCIDDQLCVQSRISPVNLLQGSFPHTTAETVTDPQVVDRHLLPLLHI